MKAIALYRVSTDTQEISRQRTEIKQLCNVRGFDLVKEFEETISGKSKFKDRPIMQTLLLYIEENEVDYVVAHELSRIGRTREVLDFLDILKEKKIGLITYKENIQTLNDDKTNNTSSDLIIGILSSINGYEIETFKYRSISGIRQSRIEGNAAGSSNIPYGYYKDENKKLLPDEGEQGEAKIIRDIFDLCIAGFGSVKIANYLNEKKIPTRSNKIAVELIHNGIEEEIANSKGDKKLKLQRKLAKFQKSKWVDGTVYSILQNEIYIGRRKHATKQLEGFKKKFEYEYFNQPQLRIISDATFFDAKIKRSKKGTKDPSFKFNYLIDRGKIICGVCGRNYYPIKRSNGNDNRYVCISSRSKSCGNAGISINKIENLLQKVILEKQKDILVSALKDDNLILQINETKEEIKAIEKTLTRIKSEVKELVKLQIKKKVDEDTYTDLQKEFINEKKKFETKLILLFAKLKNLQTTHSNLVDIDRIWNDIIKKEHEPASSIPNTIVNSIITKIVITKLSLANVDIIEQDFENDLWESMIFENNKQDVKLHVEVHSGLNVFSYVLTQRQHTYLLNLDKDRIEMYIPILEDE